MTEKNIYFTYMKIRYKRDTKCIRFVSQVIHYIYLHKNSPAS